MKLSAFIFIFFILTVATQANAQDRWQIADEATLRLKPSAFSQLPKSIVSFLETRGCTVPQSYSRSAPHNVIRGQFARQGQFDWAVLCSRTRVSSILVFWNGSTRSVGEIARAADKNYLQTIDGDGEIGFSRAIEVVGKDYILDHYRAYGGRKPPPIKHQGINDAFFEKVPPCIIFIESGGWICKAPTERFCWNPHEARLKSERVAIQTDVVAASNSRKSQTWTEVFAVHTPASIHLA